MGGGGSKLDKVIGGNGLPDSERYFGLENFGNTCYANSILQSLYYCVPFRQNCVAHLARVRDSQDDRKREEEDTLLECLCDLFYTIGQQKKRTGTYAPKRFVTKLRRENELFRGSQHQDAHEFLNYLLNTVDEILQKSEKKQEEARGEKVDEKKKRRTFIHDIFEGALSSETRCLTCETVTSREEAFLDLSIDVEHNTSLHNCLRNFFSSEPMNRDDKFYCDKCTSLQEAQRCIRIRRAPVVLAIHLKRFKYIEAYQRHKKLSYRVPFPFELRLPSMHGVPTAQDGDGQTQVNNASLNHNHMNSTSANKLGVTSLANTTVLGSTSSLGGVEGGSEKAGNDESEKEKENEAEVDPSSLLYNLFAVVVHVGSGPNMGHYVAMVRTRQQWLYFDDDEVHPISEADVQSVFGVSQEYQGTTHTGYILFYSQNDRATELTENAAGLMALTSTMSLGATITSSGSTSPGAGMAHTMSSLASVGSTSTVHTPRTGGR